MLGKGMEEGALAGLGATRDLSGLASTLPHDDDTPAIGGTASGVAGTPGISQSQAMLAHAHLSSEGVGIVPRCISDMFSWMERQAEVNTANNSTLDYSITANYLQIYNEVSTSSVVLTIPCHLLI